MKKILCFGDSNTWGHNPVDCSKLEKPWTVWLKDIVPEYEIVSDGVCLIDDYQIQIKREFGR